MPKLPVEQLTTQWIYNNYYQYKDKPLSSSVINKYAKALLDVAGADGVLSEAERKWVIGFAAAHGVGQEELDALKEYKLKAEDSTAVFSSESKLKIGEHFQAELIYNGLRAAAADGALKQREIDGISAIAKKLGIPDDKFQAILALHKEEEDERQKRIAFLFPKPYGETIEAIDHHYGR
ncbi:hypothetical protein I4U23_013178 [Adineta vaga]|nr:hypothetical protein I4U23_013178 [Adineta vaga]